MLYNTKIYSKSDWKSGLIKAKKMLLIEKIKKIKKKNKFISLKYII